MNHLAVYCTANELTLPELKQSLLYDAFNFNPRKGFNSIKNEHLRHVVNETKEIFPHPTNCENTFKGALIVNLVVMYMANIKSSIVGKWFSIIKNSINTHMKVYHSDLNKKETKNMYNKIYKRITRPQPDDDNNEEYLEDDALGLVEFHRIGFGVQDDGWVNDIFIDNKMKTSAGISSLIQHFLQCLHRQCTVEGENFDGENCLKKQLALPEFSIRRKSIYIDQKNLYYIVKQYMNDIGRGDEFIIPGGASGFGQHLFVQWLKKLFHVGEFLDIEDIKNSNKEFQWQGVVITTDGVKASLHYSPKHSDDTTAKVVLPSKELALVVEDCGKFNDVNLNTSKAFCIILRILVVFNQTWLHPTIQDVPI